MANVQTIAWKADRDRMGRCAACPLKASCVTIPGMDASVPIAINCYGCRKEESRLEVELLLER